MSKKLKKDFWKFSTILTLMVESTLFVTKILLFLVGETFITQLLNENCMTRIFPWKENVENLFSSFLSAKSLLYSNKYFRKYKMPIM